MSTNKIMAAFSSLSREAQDRIKIMARAREAERTNSSLHVQKPGSRGYNRERMTEREFVRSFGSKVVKVRWSGRSDFVGLMVLGKEQGFLVRNVNNERRLYLIDINEKGITQLTHRYLRVKDNESISNLQKGLLRWVR